MEQPGASSAGGASEAESFGPVARMMMSVAAHAITSYVQFRTLSELLVERGIITREELEARFERTRDKMIPATIEEWFEPDIAYHLKIAVESSQAAPAYEGDASDAPDTGRIVTAADPDDLAQARAMQSGQLGQAGAAQPE